MPFVAVPHKLQEADGVMKTPTNKLSVQSAFSLVELLVVIAVIAVIAAIAIPNITGIMGNAKESAARRNAQSVASIASAAFAAGATNLGADVAAVVTALQAGVTTTNGTNVFGPFTVSGLPAAQGTTPANEWYQTYLTNVPTGGATYVPNP